jgi:hypothetical protein
MKRRADNFHVTIPEGQERMRELAELHGLPELAELADHMHRRPALRKAKTFRHGVTAQIVRLVKRDAARYPDLPLDKIGAIYDIAGGRVSEILHGDYDV